MVRQQWVLGRLGAKGGLTPSRSRWVRGALSVWLGLCLSVSVLAAEQTWTVNFKDSDIQEVIKFVADATGRTLVIDPQVKGRVKVISATPLNQAQLYNLFLSVLEIHGFTAISVGDIVRVIPIKEARTTPAPIGGDGGGSDAQVTQVIQLHNITAAKVLPVIRPLVPSHSHLAAYAPSNAIIISGTQANIARVRSLLNRIDTAAVDTTEMVPLEHAQAEEAVRILTELATNEADKGSAAKFKLVADTRTNGILISGDDLQRQRLKQLIARLDLPQQQSGNVRVIYLEYARAEQVAKVLSNVVQNMAKLKPGDKGGSSGGQATIEADEDTNALLITADPVMLKSLLAVVERLDIRRAQVLVEAIIVEMEDIEGRDLGVQWLFRNDDSGFGSSVNADNAGTLGGAAQSILNPDDDDAQETLINALGSTVGQTFGLGKISNATDFVLLINALQQDTGANILSTPNLLTLDNNPASISVGQNVPFITGSYSSTGNSSSPENPFQTVTRESVGVTLEVTPHINEGDSVVLEISQEVSSLSGATATDVITNERKISTRILTDDGEIVVLGGLIKDDVQAFEQRVPLLGSIPILGRLFRSESNRVTKTNLMVFIRATVIRDKARLRGATGEKYRYIRDRQLKRQDLGDVLVEDGNRTLLPEWRGTETKVIGGRNSARQAEIERMVEEAKRSMENAERAVDSEQPLGAEQ